MISSGFTKNVLQFFIDNLSEPMFAVDAELCYVAFNQAYASVIHALYGTTLKRGASLVDVMTVAADREAALPSLRRALAGEPVVSRVCPSVPGGARRSFEVVHVPLRDGGGAVLGVGVVARDLTDAQRALEAERGLRQSEERLRLMYEQAPIAYQSLDTDGCVLEVNPSWLDLLGYTRSEIIGRWFGDLLVGDGPELFRQRFPVFKERGAVRRTEFTLRHRDGHPVPVAFDGRVERHPDGSFKQTHCVALDLTEQKALEARQATLEAHLREQQKLEALGTLASGVAHEINNPVNVILNYAELISDEVASGPVREYASQVAAQAERVARIVRDLLRFARQEKEGRTRAIVADLVADTISLAQASLRKDHILLDVMVEPGLPMLPCRPQQIQQVLTNLLTNARDALNERYPQASPAKRVALWVTRLQRDAGPWVRFEVEDHGGGIPPEVASRVFDPFFTTKARDKGTGLGLSISYGIVREHGGEIGFSSIEGGGTRFHVDLPVNDEALAPGDDERDDGVT